MIGVIGKPCMQEWRFPHPPNASYIAIGIPLRLGSLPSLLALDTFSVFFLLLRTIVSDAKST